MDESKFLERDFPKLVDAIYEAGLDPGKWPDFLRLLSEAFGDAMVNFYQHDYRINALPLHLTENYAPEHVAAYDEHFFALNPYPAYALKNMHPGQVGCAASYLPEDTVAHTEFYADWMAPSGFRADHFGEILAKNPDRISGVVVSPRDQRILGESPESLRCFSLLHSHLRRALDLNRLIGERRLSMVLGGSTWPDAGIALIVLDDQRRVLEANVPGEDILRTDTALVTDTFGILRSPDPTQDANLEKAFFEASDGRGHAGSPAPLTLTSANGNSYLSWIVPAVTGPSGEDDEDHRTNVVRAFSPTAQFVLFLMPTDKARRIPAKTIQTVLGLTPAEAEVASAISAGISPTDYANDAGLSRHTVRNQLASVHHKLGVRSNAQMVAHVWQKLSIFGQPE